MTPPRNAAGSGPRRRPGCGYRRACTCKAGRPPQAIFDDHPVARGADQAAVTATLAALTGFFLHTGRQPAPPGLPTVRAFQLAQGRAALTWLRDRTGRP